MGLIQRDALRTMVLSYTGLLLGYLNKGVLFIILLTPSEIGLINLIVMVGYLFAQVASLGSVNTVLKFFHFFRNKERSNYGFLKLILAVSVIGIAVTAALVFLLQPWISEFYMQRSPEFVDYYYWIIPVGVANLLFIVFETYLKGLFKNILPVFVNEILLRLLQTALIVLYAVDSISFHQFLIFNFLVYFIPILILIVYLVQLGEIQSLRAKIDIPKRFRKILVSYGLYSYLNSIGTVAVITLDTTMIAAMIGLSGTGVYSIVIFLTSALMVPYKSLNRISAPFIPVYWKERKMLEMDRLYKDVSGIGLIMGCVMFSLVWLNRVELFSLLKDPAYLEGIWVFFFLMIGRLADMYTGVNSVILLTSKKYRIDIVFTLVLIFLVFGLNYWLIPIYGITGAAISTMFALIAYNFLRVWYVWKSYRIHPFKINHVWVFAIFVASVLLIEWIPAFSDNFYVNVSWHTAAFGILFVLPVIALKLEPQVNDYLIKIRKRFIK